MRRAISGPIRLVTMIGSDDAPLIPHLAAHYRQLGVEEFSVICHAESPESAGYELLRDRCEFADITPFHTHFGPFRDFSLNQRLMAFAMKEHPDDWFVIADADELQLYDRPLAGLLEEADEQGCDYINGCFLDRVGENGRLGEITANSLWEGFPLAGQVSATISKALPLKIGIAKGSVELLLGQHGTRSGRALPWSSGLIQVHHFKWTRSVVDRMRARVRALEGRHVRLDELALLWEAKFALSHLDEHDGRIDVTDQRLRLYPTAARYGDYPDWRQVAEDSWGWAWALTY